MKRFLVALVVASAFAGGCAEQRDENYTTVLAPLSSDRTISLSDEVEKDEERRYVFEVPVGATYVIIELSGSAAGDADVFARLNELATLSSYDCGPQLLGSDEICLFLQDLESADLNITVRGFALVSPFNLTLKWQIDDDGDGIGTSP